MSTIMKMIRQENVCNGLYLRTIFMDHIYQGNNKQRT